MKIVLLTPGAGKMYCGGCIHDNTLVSALNKLGHQAIMLPLYLPPTLDEYQNISSYPIFFSGINVYLDQIFPLFRKFPEWIRKLTANQTLLKFVANLSSSTSASDVGEIAVSMLKGEQGNQKQDLLELITWLKDNFKPEIVCLSNSLLIGMARLIRKELGVKVVCQFQGEDSYIDSMKEPYRSQVWDIISERSRDVEFFISPSHFYKKLMAQRLEIDESKIKVVYNGINVEDYTSSKTEDKKPDSTKHLGYLARMCPAKGLHILIEAFIILKKQLAVTNLKLSVGGTCVGKSDHHFIEKLKQKLHLAGLLNDVEFLHNIDKPTKLNLLRRIDLFTVPAVQFEAFGLYVIEAMSAGAPVVQPKHSSFIELIEQTNGGILYEPNNPLALAEAIKSLLDNPDKLAVLSENARKAVSVKFNSIVMAQNFVNALEPVAT